MTVSPHEIEEIICLLKTSGVVATAWYFGRHRDTIRRICRKYGLFPPKDKPGRKTKELTIGELKGKWKEQEECDHKWYTIRCSKCSKVLGSETKNPFSGISQA